MLKDCASLISHPLSYVCNHGLCAGIFPGRLNIVVVKQQARRQNYYDKLQAYLISNGFF